MNVPLAPPRLLSFTVQTSCSTASSSCPTQLEHISASIPMVRLLRSMPDGSLSGTGPVTGAPPARQAVAVPPAVRGCARLSHGIGVHRCAAGAAASAARLRTCCALAGTEPPGTGASSTAVCRGARSVRAAAVRFVAEAAGRLGAAEVYALLLPLVQPALERPVSDLSSERVGLLGAASRSPVQQLLPIRRTMRQDCNKQPPIALRELNAVSQPVASCRCWWNQDDPGSYWGLIGHEKSLAPFTEPQRGPACLPAGSAPVQLHVRHSFPPLLLGCSSNWFSSSFRPFP